MMMPRKSIGLRPAVAVALVSAAVLAAGCVAQQPDQGGQDALIKVSVATAGSSFPRFPVELGQQLGIFKDEGIDLEIVTADPTAAMAAQMAGSIDMSLQATPNLIVARENGQHFVFFCGSTPVFTQRLTTMDASMPAEGNGDDWQDVLRSLKGKTISVAAVGDSIDLMLRDGLRGLGIDPEKDLTIIGIKPDAARTALTQGQVDAAFVPPYVDVQIVADGGFSVLKTESIPSFAGYSSAFTATKEWVEANPDVARRFCAGLDRSIDAIDDPEHQEVVDNLLTSTYGVPENRAAVDSARATQASIVSTEIHRDAIESMIEKSKAWGQGGRAITYEELVAPPAR